MKKFLRCKVCGYILEESKVKDVCPACGVPAKVFESFEEKVSEKRRMLINFHIHPIIVHFPQSFAIFYLTCLVLALIIPGEFKVYLFNTASVIAVFLPLSVLGGLVSGLFDGKIRFKKVTRPVLIKKIIIGSIFFILSLVITILHLNPLQLNFNNVENSIRFGFPNPSILIIILIMSMATLVCAALLGKTGAKLLDAISPGN